MRGKVIFEPTVCPDDISPVVRRFHDLGYDMAGGIVVTLSQGLLSIVVKGNDYHTLYQNMREIYEDYERIIVHMSITDITTYARGSNIDEFIKTWKEAMTSAR